MKDSPPDDVLSELRGLLFGGEAPKTVIVPAQGEKAVDLTQVVEDAVRESMRKDPQVLGNALEPAIRSALMGVLGTVVRSPWFWLAILLILALLVLPVWLLLAPRLDPRFQSYLDRLRNQRGLIVVAAESRPEGYYIAGLRDPLAPDPTQLLQGTGITPKEVKSRWDSYQASEPDFVLARAKRLLNPPKSVGLNFEDGVLYAKGEAPQNWSDKFQTLGMFVPGVNRIQSDLKVSAASLAPNNTKAASQPETRNSPATTSESGASSLNSSGDRVSANPQIESTLLLFGKNKSRLTLRQQRKLNELLPELRALTQDQKVRIRIVGRADRDGSLNLNEALSQRRADYVRQFLASQGITNIVADGLGISAPIRTEKTNTDKALNRSVSLLVERI